jgi:hypothetical protein
VEIISTPVVVVVVVVVVVLEVEIISTPVVVVAVVGLCRGRSSSCGKRFYSAEVVVGGVSRELSCSESVLWTTNCPLVFGLLRPRGSGHFQWSLSYSGHFTF